MINGYLEIVNDSNNVYMIKADAGIIINTIKSARHTCYNTQLGIMNLNFIMCPEAPSKVEPAKLAVKYAINKGVQTTVEEVRVTPDMEGHQTSFR